MSTAKPPQKSGGTTPPGTSGKPSSPQKGKSKGFIESSDFKPTWLETGPLSPDMLPDPQSESLADEYAALQEALQRLYGLEAPEASEAAEPEEPPVTEPDLSLPIDQPDEPADLEEPVFDGREVIDLAHTETDDPQAESEPDVEQAGASEEPFDQAPEPVIEAPVMSLPVELEEALIVEEEPETARDVLPGDETGLEASAATLVLPELDFAELEVDDSFAVEPLSSEAPIEEPPPVAGDTGDVQALLEVEAADEPAAEPVESDREEDAAPPVPVAEPVEPVAGRGRKERAARRSRPRSRLARALVVLSLLLLGVAAVTYFVKPFTRLALQTASLARPVTSPAIAQPRTASGAWCLHGEFLEGGAAPQLVDSGNQGDILANDRVYALRVPIATPGTHNWWIADCANEAIAYPPEPAWAVTAEPNEPVTFVFDADQRAEPLFFPIPYAVSALDNVEQYRLVGSFQEWDTNDPSAMLEQINNGLYQQVRRIARSGSYQAYIIAGDDTQAIDAYGRTTKPIPFAFETRSNGEYVVFLVDIDRGRASVMYDMSPLLTGLAFGRGSQLLTALLVGLAGLFLGVVLLRELILRNKRLWMEVGCPRCHEHELMRIARHGSDRLLHRLGIPAYRYRCRNCTWEGMRLSETGMAVSPGVSIARVDGVR